ncbi:hypothetical protein D0N36_00270 [Hymenobacter lapidiphilus]|uniref:hypothetical protein n=1 Tax=Hymenobacter sp. CCM 8763 TaxID=2303334 RepID=UPI000E345CE1|nr:hypothetical protein [Hymenobacter sp. CCM 8763]RFP66961.1 hypothetical protein D0N36_00270 [Hymenobacter sp. CCM 8763]
MENSLPFPLPATVAQCRVLLLDCLKSGEYALTSSDKEGSRTLCYYRKTFLRAAVGDEGTSLLRLPTDEHLLVHIGQQLGAMLEIIDGQPRWRYDLTEAEQLEQWQLQLGRLRPFGQAQQRFVASVLAEFAALSLTPLG